MGGGGDQSYPHRVTLESQSGGGLQIISEYVDAIHVVHYHCMCLLYSPPKSFAPLYL